MCSVQCVPKNGELHAHVESCPVHADDASLLRLREHVLCSSCACVGGNCDLASTRAGCAAAI